MVVSLFLTHLLLEVASPIFLPYPFRCNWSSRSKGLHWWRRSKAYKLHVELHHEGAIKRTKTGSVRIPFLNPTYNFKKFWFFLFLHLVIISYYVSARDNLYFNAERAKRRHPDKIWQGKIDRDAAQVTNVHNYRYASCYSTLLCLIIGVSCPYYFSQIQNNCYSIELFFLLHTKSLHPLGIYLENLPQGIWFWKISFTLLLLLISMFLGKFLIVFL